MYDWLRVRKFCRHRYSVFLRQRSTLGVRSITFDVLLFSIRRIICMCPGMCPKHVPNKIDPLFECLVAMRLILSN